MKRLLQSVTFVMVFELSGCLERLPREVKELGFVMLTVAGMVLGLVGAFMYHGRHSSHSHKGRK